MLRVSCGYTGWAAGEFAGRNERCRYDSTVDLIEEAGTVEFEPQRHVEVFTEGSVKCLCLKNTVFKGL